MVTHPSILLIEDSPGECELFRLALVQTGVDVALYTEQDAEAAFHFLTDRTGHHQLSLHRSPSEASGVASTARIERPPFHRGGSASTEAMPDASPSRSSEAARSASTGDRSGYPSLILLDLKLGRRNGCDFLKQLRADARFAAIPVVVFTTSDAQTDLATCYASGANGFVVKPGTFAELLQCTSDICRYWIDRNRTPYMVEARC